MNDTIEKTEFAFSELSDVAKQKARETYCSDDYPYDEWWDSVYEDANDVAKILGLDINTTKQSMRAGHTYEKIDISFSGFSSQGDGASFKGRYRYNPKAVDEIKGYCNDEKLIALAEQLTVMQIARRLQGLAYFTANITNSNYCSYSLSVNVNSEDENDEHNYVGEDLKETITQLFKDFADWIYSSLENQYDYLFSDECVDEYLNEEIFDIDGEVI